EAIGAKVAEDLAREAEERARIEAEKAEAEAREKAKREAEEKARREAEEKARKEAEEKARKEAEEKARREAEEKAKREAEEKAKREADEKARREAEEKARKEAEARAKQEAEEKARKAAEEKARREAVAKAKKEAEEKARREAEEKARREAEEQARLEAEAEAKKEAEAKALREAEAKKKVEDKARKEAEEKARREAEEKARREAEEQARLEAEAKAKKEAEEKARQEAEAKAEREAEEKARREAKEKAEAQEKARLDAEAKAKKQAAAEAKKEKEARRKADEKARKAKEAAEAQEAEAKPQSPPTPDAEPQEPAPPANLKDSFRRLIRETGPISLARYMAESNARYYSSRDPLGEEGDFITAPEVSQMFGELIGLWLADLWVRMGARKHIHYVELGPGRGTLTTDALRTAGRYDFDPEIHFVEGSPALRKIQKEAFPKATHHHDLSTLPDDAPLLIVANEFFDALPIHQLVRSADGWHERMVGLEGGELAFVAGDAPMDSIVPKSWKTATQGTMIETSAAAVSVMTEIAHRLKEQGGAAIIIDYGPRELRAGSTLQALRNHEKVDPLDCPGEADLTAHVDFELLQDVASREGADVMGLQMQGDWLIQMGIDIRTEALQRKNPGEKDKVQRQYDRLVQDNQMGALFKVLGICGRRWPIGVGFD
ncbi:MAG: SAM-dependent methyltransferase, partial [Erythrobacter sp.]